jgi:hyperosmotically inducible periplasmic protein
MNTRIVALACALTVPACGGAENGPRARDPASSSIQATPSDSKSATISAAAPVAATPRPMAGASTNMAGKDAPAGTANVPWNGVTPDADSNPRVADQTKDADNTKMNERDRRGSLTPMDQGNSGSETKITATIRKGIIADKTLSFTAKNVKVITIGSKVTLRGPVKSDREKTAIAELAQQTAGVSDVDNQLEVKN